MRPEDKICAAYYTGYKDLRNRALQEEIDWRQEEARIKEELETQKAATQHAIDHAESYKEEVEFLRTLLKKRDAGEHCYWCYADQGTECTCYHDAVQDYFKRVTINAPD